MESAIDHRRGIPATMGISFVSPPSVRASRGWTVDRGSWIWLLHLQRSDAERLRHRERAFVAGLGRVAVACRLLHAGVELAVVGGRVEHVHGHDLAAGQPVEREADV